MNTKKHFLINYLHKKITKTYYKFLSSTINLPEKDNDKEQEKDKDNIKIVYKIDDFRCYVGKIQKIL